MAEVAFPVNPQMQYAQQVTNAANADANAAMQAIPTGAPAAGAPPAPTAPGPQTAAAWVSPSTGEIFANGKWGKGFASVDSLSQYIAKGGAVQESPAPAPGLLPLPQKQDVLTYRQHLISTQQGHILHDVYHAGAAFVGGLPSLASHVVAGAVDHLPQLLNPGTPAIALPSMDHAGSDFLAAHPALSTKYLQDVGSENLQEQAGDAAPTTGTKVSHAIGTVAGALLPVAGAIAATVGTDGAAAPGAEATLTAEGSDIAAALSGASKVSLARQLAVEAAGSSQFGEMSQDQAEQQVTTALQHATPAQLAQNPVYQQLRLHGATDVQARQAMIQRASTAGAETGVATGLIYSALVAGLLPANIVKGLAQIKILPKAGLGLAGLGVRMAAGAGENEAFMAGQQALTGSAAAQAGGIGSVNPLDHVSSQGAGLNLALGAFGGGVAHLGARAAVRGASDTTLAGSIPDAGAPVDLGAALDKMGQSDAVPRAAPPPIPSVDGIQQAAQPGPAAPAGAEPTVDGIQQAATPPQPAGPPSPQALQQQIEQLTQQMAGKGKRTKAWREMKLQRDGLQQQLAQASQQAPAPTPAAPVAGEPAAPPAAAAPAGDRPEGVAPAPIPAPPGTIPPEQLRQQAAAEAARGNPMPAPGAPAPAPAPAPVPVPVPEAAAAPVFTRDMGNPQPKLGVHPLKFANDIDRALYIIANRKTQSLAHAKFIAFLRQHTGMSSADILSAADRVKAAVVEAGKGVRGSKPVTVPDLSALRAKAPDVGNVAETMPEPAADIAAQVKSVASGEKPAVWVPANALDTIPAKLPKGVFRVDRPEGTILTKSAKIRAWAKSAKAISEADLADKLGYTQTKSDVVASGEPPVTVRVTRGKNVVHEEVSTPSQADATRAKLQKQFRGSKVTIGAPETSLADRAQRAPEEPQPPKAQAAAEPTPSPEEHKAESKPQSSVEEPSTDSPPEPANAIARLARKLRALANAEEHSETDSGSSRFVRMMHELGLHRTNGTPFTRGELLDIRAAFAHAEPDEIEHALRVGTDLDKAAAADSSGPPGSIATDLDKTTAEADSGTDVGGNVAVDLGGKEIPPFIARAASVVSDWLKGLTKDGLVLGHKLRLLDFDTFIKQYGVDPAKVGRGVRGVGSTMLDQWATRHGVVVLRAPEGGAWTSYHLGTLAHEVGHVVERAYFRQLPESAQNELRQAFLRWYEAQHGKTAQESLVDRSPSLSLTDRMANTKAIPIEYARDYEEWIADNVARYLETQKEPHGALAKHFATVAAALKQLWAKLGKLEGLQPDAAVKKYMDQMRDSARDNAVPDTGDTRVAADDRGDSVDPGVNATVTDALKARAAGLGSRTVDLVTGVGKTAADALRGEFPAVKKAYADARDSKLSDTTRRLILKARPNMYYGILARARGLVSAEHFIALQKAIDDMDARTVQFLRRTNVIMHYIQNLSPQARELLNRAMYFATTHGVSIDKPWDDPRNAYLHSPDPEIDKLNRATHAEGVAKYELLKRKGIGQHYTALRDNLTDIYAHTLKLQEDAINKTETTPEAKAEAMKVIEGLREAMFRGDYFPKIRDGAYIVTADVPARRINNANAPNGLFSTYEEARAAADRGRASAPHAKFTIGRESGGDGEEGWSVFTHTPGVWMHQSVRAARAARESMLADLREAYVRAGRGDEFDDLAKKGNLLSAPKMKTDWWQEQKTLPSSFLQQIKSLEEDGKLTSAAAASMRDLYLQGLAEGSYMKTQLRDRNILGASKNMIAASARRATQAAYYASRFEKSDEMNTLWNNLHKAAIEDAKNGDHTAQIDVNELRRLQAKGADAFDGSVFNNLAGPVSNFITFATMGLSPKYLLMQAPQPWLTTHPLLAGYVGGADAAKYLSSAYDGLTGHYLKKGGRDFTDSFRQLVGATSKHNPELDTADELIARSAKTPAEAKMLQTLYDRHVLDFNWMNPLRDTADSGYTTAGRTLLRMTMAFNSQIEAMNRVVSAQAAFRMAVEKLGMDHEAATDFAQEIADKSQGNYRQANKSALLRGVTGRTIGKFKLWTLSMYHLFGEQVVRAVKDAKPGERTQALNTLKYLLVNHVAYAGLAGLGPMYAAAQLVLWGVHHAEVAMGLKSPSTDDYKDSDTLMHDFWKHVGEDIVGKDDAEEFANNVEKGPLSAYLADVSSVSGIPDLFSAKFAGIGPRDSGKDAVLKYIASLAGPVLETPASIFGDMIDGNFSGASIRALPANLRFLARAYKLDMHGAPSGPKSIFDAPDGATPWDVAAQALGIDSAHVSETYDEHTRLRSTADQLQAAASRLIAAYQSDPEDADTLQRIEKFNASVLPQFQISNYRLRNALRTRPSKQIEALKASGE